MNIEQDNNKSERKSFFNEVIKDISILALGITIGAGIVYSESQHTTDTTQDTSKQEVSVADLFKTSNDNVYNAQINQLITAETTN